MKKQKSLPKLKAELQVLFNRFIVLRDKDKPCISCGKNNYLQAGHYFAVKGYDGLRFDEDNVHGECAGCNCFDESHLINYGENLKDKIGLVRYNDLCRRAKLYKLSGYKWMRYEIEGMIDIYKSKIKND